MTATQITDVKVWRESAQGELFTLPSGNVARLRRIHIMQLVEQGQVPDTLTALVAQMISSDPRLRLSMADLKRYAEVVNVVVKAAFVEPRLADEPGEDCLGVQEVNFSDRAAVFEWCHLPTAKMTPFRPEPAADVDVVRPGDGIQPASK